MADPRFGPTLLESAIFDVVRRTLITPGAVKEMVEILNADIELRRSSESGHREKAARQVRSLERQHANLRRALRTASAAAAERISFELDVVASELAEAKRRADALDREARPYRISTKLIQELIDQMTGLLDHAPLKTRVAWVRTCSSGSTWTASSSVPWPAGRRQPIKMLAGWNQ